MNNESRIKNGCAEKKELRASLRDSSFIIHDSPRVRFAHAKRTRGFSLLELLIYIAILAGLMVVISDAFISLSKGRGRAEARGEVNSAIRFAAERIKQDIKGASVVTTPILGTASPTLQTTVSGVTVLYDVSGGQLRRTEGAGSSVLVTGTNVIVDTPTFTRLENYNSVLQATTTAIQALMTFRYNASSTDWAYAATLRTTVDLR